MNTSEYLAKPDKTIKEHTQELIDSLEILKELGYIRDEETYKLVKLACEYHDLGKVNREFQKRITAAKNGKKLKFNLEKEIFHNILSAYMIDKDSFSKIEDYHRVCHAVINHHNYCDDAFKYISEHKQQIKDSLSDIEHYELGIRERKKISCMVNDIEAAKIKGYLHKCDYSASAGYVVEYPNNFLEESLNDLMKRWQSKDSSSHWNELQKFCIKNRDENIIAVAETGMGKTEGGLQWIGDNKGFFILPIRTAINAIYERVANDLLDKKNINERVSILHSESLEYYNKRISVEEQENLDVIEYDKRGKQLSMPLSISTLDQLFDFVFKYQGFELKLTTLAYSKIVIDEIQMYGPDLLAYLIRGLEMINEMGGKIAIVTATLPPFIKKLLSENISFKCGKFIKDKNKVRHNVKVLNEKINSEDVVKKYKENIANNKGNKILVICNTIKKAQQLYKELKESDINSKEIHILHSRYIKVDRERKEQEIIEFGKTYKDNGEIDIRNGIWISTSLVEASLDIDFDCLFTELQDINSLFQRFGRCNRKGAKNCEEVNCYVYTDVEHIKIGNRGFIDKTIFDLSKKALQEVDGKITEDEKIALINKYFRYEDVKDSDFIREYKRIYDFIKGIQPYDIEKKEVDLRNILSEDIIPEEVYKENEEKIIKAEKSLAEDNLNSNDRLKLIRNIKKFIVSIPMYEAKKAEVYSVVKINKYEEIKVIQCGYNNELGYYKVDDTKSNNNIL
ncbi:CRISPR-associated helicase Cas3' [Clostridium sp. MSJ-8]|uniref:CRISPR-associated helicase Cas3' n=1 Tax=Clostridium sp. MSJ-8 TaxID=2841510 RepID=UPI001C0EA707|nr:CRISPR-associated helicase Cas3' [Clostridium sp. MSJ-8]MBU5487890.1 CRISPR-associated helicase Cas3' [Clostridium sp. MSJ-8]